MTRFENVLIRASAGTGKTFQLSNRYIGLMEAGAPPDEILATTFTRKAAGEILDRVIERLAEAASDDRAASDLAEQIDAPMTTQRCTDMLAQLTSHLHRLRVSTLDSFFSQIASTFSLELGLPPGWKIVEELVDSQLRSEAIESILHGDATVEITRLMNLITKGDAARSVSDLVRSTVRALYNLYLETDKDSWHQLPEYPTLKEEELLWANEQLKSVAAPEDQRIMKQHLTSILLAAEGNWEGFVSSGIPQRILNNESTYYKKPIPVEIIQGYLPLLAHAKGVLVRQVSNQTTATWQLLNKFHAVYQKLKYDSRAMRFEDITRRLAQKTDVADIDQLEFRLDAQISHLLFDEFQDTSLSQWQVVRPFAERVTFTGGQQAFFWEGGQKSFFCVGDVKQAIYAWRGGKSEIFEALEANLSNLTHESLTRSYRSSPTVIDTVNQIFGKMSNHTNLDKYKRGVDIWCERFAEHTTARESLPGYTCLLTSHEEAGKDPAEHFSYVADEIQNITQRSPGYSVGVLVRTNKAVGKLIFELRRRGVPASEEGGNPLTDSVAVQSILSLLLLADHPGNTVARFHVATTPLGKILDYQDPGDLDATERLAQRVRSEVQEFGYGRSVTGWCKNLLDFCNRRDASRLQQLGQLAYEYQSIASLRPADFVRYVEQQRVKDPSSADVRVMTVHQSKGLQFDVVVLPELDAKLLGQHDTCVAGQDDPTQPVDRVCVYRNESIRSVMPEEFKKLFDEATDAKVNEALCVLYVALTRAVHSMYMIVKPSTPLKAKAANSSKPSVPSQAKTYAGIIHAALAPQLTLDPQTILFEHGDPEWSATLPPRESRPVTESGPAIHPPKIQLVPMPNGRRIGLGRTAPSSLEGGERIALSDVIRIGNAGALARGTLIHGWFELIDWIEDGKPSRDQLEEIASGLEIGDLNLTQEIDGFYRQLEKPGTQHALSRSNYIGAKLLALNAGLPADLSMVELRLQVENERRFAVRDGHQILSGSIDRLVLVYEQGKLVAADVVDYKTDAVSLDEPESIERAIKHYRPQLQAYQRAVSKMLHIPSSYITTRLLFLGIDQLRQVD